MSLIKILTVFGISMVPVIELRGALPTALAMGMNPILAYILCVVGNSLPVPFLVMFVRPIFEWMKKKSDRLRKIVEKLEAKAEGKVDKVRKYEKLGLFVFVAIPLPGTGAWTGSLIAAVFGMRLKDSVPMILLGVAVAGIIVSIVYYLVYFLGISALGFLLG